MAVYAVHLPGKNILETSLAAVADAAFIREGFSWGAFFFGPFWLVWHGLWLGLALWVAAFILYSGAAVFDPSSSVSLILAVFVQILFGLEGNHLRQMKLVRRGFRLVEIVAAPALEEAEGRFFNHVAEVRAPLLDEPAPLVADEDEPVKPDLNRDVLGLFSWPEDKP